MMLTRTAITGPPDGYTEIASPAGMSNATFEVEPGVEDRLRSCRVYTHYAGWDFNGKVWLNAEGSFSCQVWVHHQPVATVIANTLHDLMHEVSDEFGYD